MNEDFLLAGAVNWVGGASGCESAMVVVFRNRVLVDGERAVLS